MEETNVDEELPAAEEEVKGEEEEETATDAEEDQDSGVEGNPGARRPHAVGIVVVVCFDEAVEGFDEVVEGFEVVDREVEVKGVQPPRRRRLTKNMA